MRSPDRQVGARLAAGLIDGYQSTLSKAMPSLGVQCRFEPTCSHYAKAAIQHRGLVPGLGAAAWRILRCGPWTERGTIDPPLSPKSSGAATTTLGIQRSIRQPTGESS